jgi:hypothetical protein
MLKLELYRELIINLLNYGNLSHTFLAAIIIKIIINLRITRKMSFVILIVICIYEKKMKNSYYSGSNK